LHECSLELEVPFHDVDAQQIVWHGHYFKYLELARTQLLRGLGLDTGHFAALRVQLVVVDSACRYLAPLRYADRLRVSAWIRDFTHRIAIDYAIQDLTHQRPAARAHTILACITPEGRILHRTPAALRERLAPCS